MTDLVYVYAVLPKPLGTALNGLEGRTVRWVVANDLAAAVSDVPGEEFNEGPLNENVRHRMAGATRTRSSGGELQVAR